MMAKQNSLDDVGLELDGDDQVTLCLIIKGLQVLITWGFQQF